MLDIWDFFSNFALKLLTNKELEQMKRHLILLLSAILPLAAIAVTLKRVSVHDPSVVWDPSSKTYYIFGSHRDHAKTTDMMNWTKITVPWQTATSSNAANTAAFTTPQVTSVKKGGKEYSFNFNAHDWAKKGSTRKENTYDVNGMMWAPDVIWNPVMKKWCMYLSINGDYWYSSIILLTADNIEGPYRYQAPVVISGFFENNTYKETDLEIVLGTQSSLPDRYALKDSGTGNWGERYPNCIDPCVFYDEEGKLWMSYGSWSGGIYMLELDENTGLRDYDVEYTLTGTGNGITVDPYFGKKVAGGYYVSGEASYIEYIGGYYFLFVTYGGLTADGGYQMRVFRSTNPDGPYKDSNNISAVYSNYQLNYGANAASNRGVNIFGAYSDWGNQAKGNNGERSQGHNSIIAAEDGRTYLVYHTRFQNQGEGHQVRVHQVFQNKDGWLVAAPFEYTGEEVKSEDIANTQQISTSLIPGTYKLLLHKYKLNNSNKETVKPVEVTLTADKKITGDLTGTWSVTEGTSYVNFVISSKAYRGVMVLQTMEPKDTKAIAFTGLYAKTGETIWAYKEAAANVKGDVNGDGGVTAIDIIETTKYLIGNASSSFNKTNADVNGDGSINIADIIAMAKLIVTQ